MQGLLRFTLDLFEPTLPRPSPAETSPSLKNAKKGPPAQENRQEFAIEKIASGNLAPSQPQSLQEALAPAIFHHPQATREALLDGILVAFKFRRGKRSTIGFSVGSDGLSVSAPRWVPLIEIDKAVREKSGWIVKKLQETRERHQRMESGRIDWKNGCVVPFLGEPVIVVLDPRHAFGGVGAELKNSGGLALSGVTQPTLHIGLSHNASADQIRDAVQAWLMRQAKRLFTERLTHFAPHLGVQWRKVSLSSAGTRWGSANADGSIRLNWRLIHFKQAVIDYVVVHELSHLRVMDHSPRFWDTVRAVVPDYAALRGQLKNESVPLW